CNGGSGVAAASASGRAISSSAAAVGGASEGWNSSTRSGCSMASPLAILNQNQDSRTCPRLVESYCLSFSFALQLYGAFVVKCRMPADGIIKAIDISGDCIRGLAA